jgi:hypothetical protein
MRTYHTPVLVDRGSVNARTLGCGRHRTLEASSSFRATTLASTGDDDPVQGKTYERDWSGDMLIVGGEPSIVDETSGDGD